MVSKLITGGKALGAGLCDATLNDAALIDLLAAYRRRVAGNYRALPPDDIDKIPPGRMWLSTKLDGELWFLVQWDKETFLANSQGLVIAGDVPALKQVKTLPDHTIVAGELHALVEGRRARVGDLAAAMAGGKKAKTKEICFSAFDLVQDGGTAVSTPYDVRHARIEALIKSSSNLSVIAVEDINTAAQIKTRFEATVTTGEVEGLVIRLDSGLIYKLKPSVSIDAAIIAYTVKSDQPDSARSILLGLMHEDGRMQILGGCGNLGSDEDRKALLPKLEKLKVESSVRYASDSGSLYTFVKPELVAEIRVNDLQSDRSDGTTSMTMMISHDKTGWTGHGMRPSPRPIHPVLERLRSDKKANTTDIRFEQVAAYLPTDAEATKPDAALPASQVLRREVWTKEAKGQIAVRKLLVWKTNKATADRNFPAYVVHWTDYSSGRGSPLDREVRLAPDAAEATKIADAMVEENIKKGWNKIPE